MAVNLRESLNPDLIGALPDGRYTMPKPAFEVVNAAARRFLALTETGPDYEAAMERFRVVTGNIDGISPGDVRSVVDAALADYLTEEGP